MNANNFEILFYNNARDLYPQTHNHEYYEFLFFLKGHAAISIEEKSYRPKYGDIAMIPPGALHCIQNLSQNHACQMFMLRISAGCCKQLGTLSTDYLYIIHLSKSVKQYIFHCDSITFNAIHAKLIELMEELHSNRFGKKTKLQIGLQDLIFHMNRGIHETQYPVPANTNNTLCCNIVEYINQHIDQELTLDHLSKKFFINKYHISHTFKANFGVSVHQFITKKRLSLCRDAILRNDEISKVFINYGFKDYTGFYRAFKKEYGISPNEFKKLFCNISDSVNLFLL